MTPLSVPPSPDHRPGKNRRFYLPSGLLDPATDVPSYMDGTLAGDYGFDPLKLGADGKINDYRAAEAKPIAIKKGERVMYFKYAGDKMYDGDGKEYVVLHENDVLAVM